MSSLQLVSDVVQEHPAGEQETHWHKGQEVSSSK